MEGEKQPPSSRLLPSLKLWRDKTAWQGGRRKTEIGGRTRLRARLRRGREGEVERRRAEIRYRRSEDSRLRRGFRRR
jgi:hypothetical protein